MGQKKWLWAMLGLMCFMISFTVRASADDLNDVEMDVEASMAEQDATTQQAKAIQERLAQEKQDQQIEKAKDKREMKRIHAAQAKAARAITQGHKQLSRLQAEHKALVQKETKAKAELQKRQKKLADLTEQLDKARMENQTIVQLIGDQARATHQAQAEFQKRQKTRQSLVQKTAKLKKAFQIRRHRLKAMEQKTAQMDQSIQSLRDQATHLRDQNIQARSDLRITAARMRDSKQRLATMKKSYSASTQKMAQRNRRLQSQLESQKAKEAALQLEETQMNELRRAPASDSAPSANPAHVQLLKTCVVKRRNPQTGQMIAYRSHECH